MTGYGRERELWLAREVARRLWDPDWPRPWLHDDDLAPQLVELGYDVDDLDRSNPYTAWASTDDA